MTAPRQLVSWRLICRPVFWQSPWARCFIWSLIWSFLFFFFVVMESIRKMWKESEDLKNATVILRNLLFLLMVMWYLLAAKLGSSWSLVIELKSPTCIVEAYLRLVTVILGKRKYRQLGVLTTVSDMKQFGFGWRFLQTFTSCVCVWKR